MRAKLCLVLGLVAAALSMTGCGGGGSASQPVTVTVTPQGVSLRGGDTKRFFASVSGLSDGSVTWSVNGTAGGSASLGTIDSSNKLPRSFPCRASSG